jgi:hypothetical protein
MDHDHVTVSFYLSVGLVLAAVAIALMSREPILPSVFGTLGTANILLFLLTRPQENLQSSRASLAQLQAALYTWFMNTTNLFTPVELTAEGRPEKIQIGSVVESVTAQTSKTSEMLQKYCKLTRCDRKPLDLTSSVLLQKAKKQNIPGVKSPDVHRERLTERLSRSLKVGQQIDVYYQLNSSYHRPKIAYVPFPA